MAWTSLQDLVLGIYQKIRTGSVFTLLCSLNVLLAIRLLDEWFDWKRSYFVSVLWSKPSKGFQSNFTTAVLTILKRPVRAKGICRHNWCPVSPTLPLLLVSLLLPQLQQYCFPGSSNILGHSCLRVPELALAFAQKYVFPVICMVDSFTFSRLLPQCQLFKKPFLVNIGVHASFWILVLSR